MILRSKPEVEVKKNVGVKIVFQYYVINVS